MTYSGSVESAEDTFTRKLVDYYLGYAQKPRVPFWCEGEIADRIFAQAIEKAKAIQLNNKKKDYRR